MKVSHCDKFNIYSSFTLSNDDISCLSLLYLPIIGAKALAIYLSFDSLIHRSNLASEEYKHSFILDLLKMEPNDFEKNRKILEAIGLLSHFQKDDSHIYLLRAPLSARNFFASNVHGLMLYSDLGKDMFDDLRQRFTIKMIDKDIYKDVSTSFDEVFEIHATKPEKTDEFLVSNDSKKAIKIKNANINFTLFASKIDQALVSGGITKEFENLILTTANNYQFDEEEMASLFRESIASNGYFDAKLLKRKAKVLFTYKTNSELPAFSVKGESAPEQSPENQAVIDEIENCSGEEFLSQVMDNEYDNKYLVNLNELYNEINLPQAVIRIMVIYVVSQMKKKNGYAQFPALAYFKKVADDWILNGYTDVYSAYDFYINGPKEEPKRTYKKRTRVKKPNQVDIENRDKDIMEGVEVL